MIRHPARMFGLVLGVATQLALADIPPECESISRGPRIILEPIVMGSAPATLETSQRIHSLVMDSWKEAMNSKQPGLPLAMVFDDCWSYRQRTTEKWDMPDILDFNLPRVRTMKANKVVAVVWGRVAPAELRIDFGIVRILAADPPERGRVVRIKAPSQRPPHEMLDELFRSDVLTTVGLLGAIDVLLDDFETSDRIDDSMGPSRNCWRSAIRSQILTAELRAAKLTAGGDNRWIAEWIDELRDRVTKAKGKNNATCLG